MDHISVSEFESVLKSNNKDDYILLDVRSNEEFSIVNIGGQLIPLDELETRFKELDLNKKIYCLCHHGMRSQMAANFLLAQGARKLINISGGIHAYAIEVDSSLAQY
jgi:rhodanese-related sulfurtransferase